MTEQRRYPGDVEFAFRVLHDAWLEGSAMYWERRARQLEAARPRRGDFTGRATLSEITQRHQQLTEAAAACRNRGRLHSSSAQTFRDTITDLAGGVA